MDGVDLRADSRGWLLSSSEPWRMGLLAAILFGIVIRTFHYLSDPSMWGDEASAVLNVINKGYSELWAKPLSHESPSPILFLWIERFACDLFGDSTLSLRVPTFFASVLLLPLAGVMFVRWSSLSAACISLTLLATSNRLLWHSIEAKPYAIDVLLAILLPTLFCLTRRRSFGGRMLLWAALAPVVITLSYPGVFMMAGILLASLPELKSSRRRDWIAWFASGGVSAGVFLMVLLGPARQQRTAQVDSCWTNYFPDWSDPLGVPFWIIKSWASLPDYSFRPIGMLLLPGVILGGYLMFRRGRERLVIALTAPIALAFLASLLGKYPFGGARVLAFAAPAMSLFVGESIAWLLARCREPIAWPRWGVSLAAIPLAASIVYANKSFFEPWPSPDSVGAARWVIENRAPGDLIVGNHWEHEYYFRSLGSSFRAFGSRQGDEPRRVWLVMADVSPEVRRSLIDSYSKSTSETAIEWRVVVTREFQHTSVVSFERVDLATSRDSLSR
jgi:hypothetical protein